MKKLSKKQFNNLYFMRGYSAYYSNIPQSSCPYGNNTYHKKVLSWIEGWFVACEQDLTLQSYYGR